MTTTTKRPSRSPTPPSQQTPNQQIANAFPRLPFETSLCLSSLFFLSVNNPQHPIMPIGAVQISPETEIKFELSQSEATPKAVITLKHPGGDVGAIAFKVSRRLVELSTNAQNAWFCGLLCMQGRKGNVWLGLPHFGNFPLAKNPNCQMRILFWIFHRSC